MQRVDHPQDALAVVVLRANQQAAEAHACGLELCASLNQKVKTLLFDETSYTEEQRQVLGGRLRERREVLRVQTVVDNMEVLVLRADLCEVAVIGGRAGHHKARRHQFATQEIAGIEL